ncbi:MAG: NADAR family protein [Verrucomicrobiota bacterium]
MSAILHFYQVDKPYGGFSNFSRHPIECDGVTWPTSEHYFQAQKFAGDAHKEEIRLAATPMLAARMGRERSRPLRPDWELVKDDVMRTAVRAKFTRHAALREELLSTGDAILVEHTSNDRYWGDGGDGTGKNMLGIILMEIREELRGSGNAA